MELQRETTVRPWRHAYAPWLEPNPNPWRASESQSNPWEDVPKPNPSCTVTRRKTHQIPLQRICHDHYPKRVLITCQAWRPRPFHRIWDKQFHPDRCDLQSAWSDSMEFSTAPGSGEIRADLTWLKRRSDSLLHLYRRSARIFLQVQGPQLSRMSGRWAICSINWILTFHSSSRVANTAHRHIILTSSTSKWLSSSWVAVNHCLYWMNTLWALAM